MYNILGFLKDIWLQISLRIRIFLRDRFVVVVYVIAILCFVIIFRSLNIQATEKSGVPIGVVNLDSQEEEVTEYSAAFVERLKTHPLLFVYEGDLESLEEMLYDGYIHSIYVIESGYENKIKKGFIDELVTVYEGSDSALSMVVSDIAAGEMMAQICLEKGYLKYKRYPAGDNGKHSEADYREYAEILERSDEIEFGFLITYKNGDFEIEDTKIDSSVLYRQIIAGIAAMIFSFVILFVLTQNVMEKENEIYKRRKLTLIQRTAVSLGNVLTVLLVLFLLVAVFARGFTGYALVELSFVKIFLTTILYCAMMALLFELLSIVITNIFWFQISGSIIIVLFGVIGFLTMVEGIVIQDMGLFSDIIPNSWFVKTITKNIL